MLAFGGKKNMVESHVPKTESVKKHLIGNLKTQTFMIKHIKIKTYWKHVHHVFHQSQPKKKLATQRAPPKTCGEDPNSQIAEFKQLRIGNGDVFFPRRWTGV